MRLTRPARAPLARLVALAALLSAAPLAAASLGAQGARPDDGLAPPPARRTIVAVNPLGALMGILSGEAERVVAPSVGIGVGATHWSFLSDRLLSYSSADARLRWYVSGTAPTGMSVGAVAGLTRVSSSAAGRAVNAVGTGVELSYGELAGRDRRLYLGVGAGAKRLFPLDRELDRFRFAYPTARVAVGWAF